MKKGIELSKVAILFCLFLAISEVNAKLLFSLHGSNTIGANLAPQCAKYYLETIYGARQVRVVRTAIDNEYMINGLAGEGDNKTAVTIKILAHGSSTGFTGLLSGQADIAMSSRPISMHEIKSLNQSLVNIPPEMEHTIAIDGLAVLVNKNNPVNDLTIRQLGQIFSGAITNWQQVGGPDLMIQLYARNNQSGTWATFKQLVLRKQFQLHESALRFESNSVLSDMVAKNIKAIGFTGLASVRRAKLLAVSDTDTQAMVPDEYTVATEDYPLTRRLFLYLPETKTSPLAGDFVRFCQSLIGQDIARKVGFISQNIRLFKTTVSEGAPEIYQRLVKYGQRLSVNFRFAKGSPRLDNKAYNDIERLVKFLRDNKNHHKYVYLVGFSEASKGPQQDLLLSRFRALAVYSQLSHDGIAVEKSFGLGSFNPVVTNTDTTMKLKNSRVEVWVTEKPLSFEETSS